MKYGKLFKILCGVAIIAVPAIVLSVSGKDKEKGDEEMKAIRDYSKKNGEKEIYLAAGCFWGTEAFMKKIDGVKSVTVGYANGKTEDTDYGNVKATDHAEAAHIIYNPEKTNLTTILTYYFKIIDPVSVNRQGNDIGRQYRTGIYYTDEKDRPIIEAFVKNEQKKYDKKIAVEVEPLKNYIPAEEYHQNYLGKNPNGYCHIDLKKADEKIHVDEIKPEDKIEEKAVIKKYEKKPKEELKKELSDMQYSVTQENATEVPFHNEYYNNFKKGIYVDITTGEPLFLSTDKFESGCGWPSFSKPLDEKDVRYVEDNSYGMKRTEVRSSIGDAHLGHVFDDGPKALGGKRYCINSASLKFIPYEKMEEEGYGKYMKELDE